MAAGTVAAKGAGVPTGVADGGRMTPVAGLGVVKRVDGNRGLGGLYCDGKAWNWFVLTPGAGAGGTGGCATTDSALNSAKAPIASLRVVIRLTANYSNYNRISQ